MKYILMVFSLLFFASCGGNGSIIGTPIKIGSLEVAEHDFPRQMTWEEANNACNSLGDGWRLPTEDELILIFQNKRDVGAFDDKQWLWSSTEDAYGDVFVQYYSGGQSYLKKDLRFNVRAVRVQ